MDIEPVIRKHIEIMDQYDPEKKIDLLVDEWGTWFDVKPGTNPGHLFQQNTMRDAIVAALNLNIFHKYTDRIKMTNIAQVANVLQAMVLTEGDKIQDYNGFDTPDTVCPAAFKGFRVKDGKITVSLPAKSVVSLTVM